MLRLRKLRYIAVAAVLGACAFAALIAWTSNHVGAQTQAAAPPPPVVVSAPLKRTITDSLVFEGQFAPIEHVEVRARVNGYLNEVDFRSGQIVKKGDLLFVIDPRPYQNALALAKAQVEQAEAALQLANRQQARGADLVKKEYLAQSEYDSRVQQVSATQAQLDAARAQLHDAELNLEFTRVTAPVIGRIGTHQVSIGNLISGGGGGAQATLLTTIVSLDPIWFTFDMSERDYLTFLRAGGVARQGDGRIAGVAANLRREGDTGWPLAGQLDFLDNQIDPSTGTIRARATLANPDLAITPGEFGHLRLPVGQPHEALMVPDAAVVTDQTLRFLMTVAEDGTVKPKQVTLGPIVDGLREIRSGLDPADRVVIDGLLRVRAGAKVTPQPGDIVPTQSD